MEKSHCKTLAIEKALHFLQNNYKCTWVLVFPYLKKKISKINTSQKIKIIPSFHQLKGTRCSRSFETLL